MPVRKIPKSYRNITGQISSSKAIGVAGFESSLERDFLIILDFNYMVNSFEIQPCKIEYIDTHGKLHVYTPDVLVEYYSDHTQKSYSILYEVKYRGDLFTNWKEWRTRFKAAYSYAKAQGWKFKIITEYEIRQPYLETARFLRDYNSPIEDSRLQTATIIMRTLRETDPETLVAALASDFSNRAEVTYLVWQMLAKGYLHMDYTQPLNMKTRIWLN